MASASLPRTWNVFTSFHGPDVRKTFLTHLRKQFSYNGISMFDDEGIERSQVITPALIQAIRGSRISIVLLTENYASSSWCLDELVEILKCKQDLGQIVMTIFYGVDPSDVARQTGDFGIAFNNMCSGKTTEEISRWSQALDDAANIAGEDFQNWDNEAKMIEKIAKDVSNKLNATPSRDFDGMVGLEAHLREMESLLDLDYGGAKVVAVTGPAGIGKSTIARALLSKISHRFQLTCFMEDMAESYPIGLDEYGKKLRLQKQFLSNVLNQNGIQICHLGTIKQRLCDQRVLIIFDDVQNIKQLEALADETTWFGRGSRIVVITKNREVLRQHGITNTYHVGFPSDEQALEMLCRYAFKQSYPHSGYEKLANKVTKLCGNLPLGLSVVGSSLRGENEEGWEDVITRLETILDHPDIVQVLRVGYESLHENEQSLFLHIAVFFNYKDDGHVKDMFTDSKLDIKHGLKILVNRCLLCISTDGEIVMHKLLQRVGMEAVGREKPWRNRILIDAVKISDVLERAKGTSAVSGISYDVSDIEEVSISKKAFERMPNLRFLKVYKSKEQNVVVHIPEEMEFPRGLRLLDWVAYPRKCLHPTFQLERLVELNMQESKLEYLWQGTKMFGNLKKLNLSGSLSLKELPDLSYCTNLEDLMLSRCDSLEELPSSIGNLHKLERLEMMLCDNLQVLPTQLRLASLERVDMLGCWNLKKLPDIATNIRELVITDTMLEQVPDSIIHWSGLVTLHIYGSVDTLQYYGRSIIDLGDKEIEELPDWIKDLQGLQELRIAGCPKLASLSELPPSLLTLRVETCESLENLFFPFGFRVPCIFFFNCTKLSREAQRVITSSSLITCLPGKTMHEDFDHRAIGNLVTIRTDFKAFRICVIVSPKERMEKVFSKLLCRIHLNGCLIEKEIGDIIPSIQTEHVFISCFTLRNEDGWREQDNQILFEFSSTSQEVDIVECGVTNSHLEIFNDECCDSTAEQVPQDDSSSSEPRAKRRKN